MEQIEWVLVPKNATQEMCAAAVVFANGASVYETVAEEALKIEESIYGESYAAMIAAAPEVTKVGLDEWDIRGELAGALKCWCRLTGDEASELVALFEKLTSERNQLILAEEGAKDAFEAVVQAKRKLESECKRLQSLLDCAYSDIKQMSSLVPICP